MTEPDEYVAAGILPPDLDPEEVGAVVRAALDESQDAFRAAKALAERWLRGADTEYRGTSPAEHALEEIGDIMLADDRDFEREVKVLAELIALWEIREVEPETYPSSPRHPDPRCHECGERLGDEDRAEAYLDPASLKRRAGGQDVLVDELPEDAFGPFLLHADPCFTANREKYALA